MGGTFLSPRELLKPDPSNCKVNDSGDTSARPNPSSHRGFISGIVLSSEKGNVRSAGVGEERIITGQLEIQVERLSAVPGESRIMTAPPAPPSVLRANSVYCCVLAAPSLLDASML